MSIVIPVYKVEDYIEKCLLSLASQDLASDQYEIIVINDGSPDRSRDIVLALARQITNIILIDQPNQGVSAARNAGIRKARGKYLLFVDPDDFLDPDCLGTLARKMEERPSCDVMMMGLREVQLNGEVTFTDSSVSDELQVSGFELYHNCRKLRGDTAVDAAYGMLIRRELVMENDLFFLEKIPYLEDGEFIARLFCVTTAGAFVPGPYYNRLIRPGSATHSNLFFQEPAIRGFVKAAASLRDFRDRRRDQDQKTFLNQPIAKFVMLSIQACAQNMALLSKVKEWLRVEALIGLELDGCNRFFRRYGRWFNRSINLFFALWMLRLARLSVQSRLKKLVPS